MQTFTSNCDERANSDAVGLWSFRSFGDGCEWAHDSSGALTIRAADGALGVLPAGVWPWANVIDQVTSVVIGPGVKAGSSLDDMFNGVTSLASADLSELDASGASTINRMFKDCSSLVDVNLKGFDSSNANSMSQLFSGCSSLVAIDLSSIDNLSVVDPYSGLDGFFEGCTKLSSITLGQRFSHGGGQDNSHLAIFPKLPVDQGFTNQWRSSRDNRLYIRDRASGYCEIPDRVAATYTAEKLEDDWRLFCADYDYEIPVSNSMWKVDNGTLRIAPYRESDDADPGLFLRDKPWEAYVNQITAISIEGECDFRDSISGAFSNMPALKTADLSGLSLLRVRDMTGLFAFSSLLESVTFNSNCESNVRSYDAMFRGCASLKSIDMSGVDCGDWAIVSVKNMFDGCVSLESVDVSGTVTNRDTIMDSMFNGCTALRSIAVGNKFTFRGEYVDSKILPNLGSGYTGKWVSSADGIAYAWDELPEFVAAIYTPEQGTPEMVDISNARIWDMKTLYSDDETVPSSPSVTLGNTMLVKDVDYTFERVHNYEACPDGPSLGKWEYIVRGTGNYTGEIRYTFYIKHVVEAPTVTQQFVYNGGEQSCLDSSALPPMVKIQNEKAINPGNHTTYVYFDDEDADFYMWDKSGSREIALYWWISKADPETTLTVTGFEDKYAWTGSPINPEVRVYVPWQEKPLVEDQDYSVSYNNNVAIGTATITISPNQNYFNGYKSVEFEIVESVVPEPDPTIGGTWKGSAGTWWYQYSDGSYLKSCWKDIDGARYYFDDNGYAKAGWALIDGFWYWFDPSTSAMRTGWQGIGGIWYWFSESGAMKTGWQQIDSAWYLLSGSGAMLTGWQLTGGAWYYLGGSGAMRTGWHSIGGTWYWFSDSGMMVTGWRQIAGQWYYFAGSGTMLTGWQQIGSAWYYLGRSGVMQHDRWVGDYYLTSSGAMATNQWIGSYYVGADGRWDNR